MATTKAYDVLTRVKTTLQEVTQQGTRWANTELLTWLNESYQAIVQNKPDAAAVNENLTLIAGTKQSIPENGLRFIDATRCTHALSRGEGIIITTRRSLDSTRRAWHRETETKDIEHFIFDEMDPRNFYVYPPAEAGATIEVVYSSVPAAHSEADIAPSSTATIKLNDSYAPVMVDYMLYRAYSKDAEHSANLNRAMMHKQAYREALGLKTQVDMAVSPNRPQG